MKKTILSLALPPFVFAAILSWNGFRSLGSTVTIVTQTPETVIGPTSWVAYSADIEIGFSSDPPLRGKFYRASDGSSRTELYEPNGDVNMFSIANVPEQRMYFFDRRNGWRVTRSPVTATPTSQMRLAVLGRKSAKKWYGVDVYEWVLSGLAMGTAPELNFERVYYQSIEDGRSRILRNVTFEEPPPALFSPPPGVPVKAATPMKREGAPSDDHENPKGTKK